MLRGSRVAAVVVARMGSSRLPGKMLADLGGASVLARVCERIGACGPVDDVVLATTREPEDDALVSEAGRLGVPVHRGSTEDVVGRMQGAVAELVPEADLLVRVCADNPLLMPTVVEDALEQLVDARADLITPFEHATYPFGYGLVAMSGDALARIDEGARAAVHREHVENYCFDHPEAFRVRYQVAPPELTFPELCLTLDWPADLVRLRRLYRVVSELAYPDQPRALVDAVRATPTWVEGRDARRPTNRDLVLATRVPEGVDPAAHPAGVLVVQAIESEAGRRWGLRYATPAPDGAPEAPVFLDAARGPDHESAEAFLERVADDALPSLLAAPARACEVAEASAMAASKCERGGRRRGFANPAEACFPARVLLDLAEEPEELLERLLVELEGHPETTVSFFTHGPSEAHTHARWIRFLEAEEVAEADAIPVDPFHEVRIGGAQGSRLLGTGGCHGSIQALWNAPELRRARAQALNREDGPR